MPPTLPAILSPSLLHSLRNNSRIPPGVWYYATAVTLSALNRPDEIPRVFESAIADDSIDQVAGSRSPDSSSPQLSVARRLRESLVKSAAIVGLPKTINALLELRRHTPDHLLDPPMGVSPTGRAIEMASVDSSALLHRGETFFAKVYGKVNARVMGQMDRCGTEDLGLIARLMYGYLLSNTKVLSPAESSFVLLAGLIPQDVNPQLKGHLRGALNNGATVDQVRAVRGAVIDVCLAAGMTKLAENEKGSWGWREDVANL